MTNIHPFSEFLESLRIDNNSQKIPHRHKRAAKSSFEKFDLTAASLFGQYFKQDTRQIIYTIIAQVLGKSR